MLKRASLFIGSIEYFHQKNLKYDVFSGSQSLIRQSMTWKRWTQHLDYFFSFYGLRIRKLKGEILRIEYRYISIEKYPIAFFVWLFFFLFLLYFISVVYARPRRKDDTYLLMSFVDRFEEVELALSALQERLQVPIEYPEEKGKKPAAERKGSANATKD